MKIAVQKTTKCLNQYTREEQNNDKEDSKLPESKKNWN